MQQRLRNPFGKGKPIEPVRQMTVNRNRNSSSGKGIPELTAAIVEAINRATGSGVAITGAGNRISKPGSAISRSGNRITGR